MGINLHSLATQAAQPDRAPAVFVVLCEENQKTGGGAEAYKQKIPASAALALQPLLCTNFAATTFPDAPTNPNPPIHDVTPHTSSPARVENRGDENALLHCDPSMMSYSCRPYLTWSW